MTSPNTPTEHHDHDLLQAAELGAPHGVHPHPTDPLPPEPPEEKRRGLKVLRHSTGLLVVLLIVLGGLVALTRTPLTRSIVLASVESATGARASAASVVLRTDGTVELREFALSTPGIPGEAGVFFRADRAALRTTWGDLFSGTVSFRSVELDAPVIRLSQSTESGVYNFVPLLSGRERPDEESEGIVISALPTLLIRDGIIELGEHDRDGYRAVQKWAFGGGVSRDDEGRSVLRFDQYASDGQSRVVLLDDAGDPTQTAVELGGLVSDEGAVLTLGAIDFSAWPTHTMPAPTRAFFDRVAPAGTLAGAQVRVSPEGELSAVVTLRGVGVTLPFDSSGNFATEGPLVRMDNTRGEVRFESGGLHALLEGNLAELPYRVTVDTETLSDQTPFRAEFITVNFRLGGDDQLMLFLPEDATYPLSLFGNPTATVDARVVIARAERGGRVELRGDLSIRDGSAAYHEFPYRFNSLQGTATFTRDRTDFHRLSGVAPNGATLVMTGFIGPYDDDAVADLRFHCEGIPIDDTLRAAMEPDELRTLDVLFSPEGYAGLIESGLIVEPGEDADHAENGPPAFAMGGTANIDVTVTRRPGPPGDRWDTLIKATIPTAGMVPEHFAYPIIAEDVELTVSESTARLEGGRYRGLRGGRAIVGAEVGVKGGTDAPVDVRVTSVGFPVDEMLVHALPDPEGAEESIRRVVSEMHVGGLVDANATIQRRDSGRLGYDVEVTLNGVTASPRWSVSDAGGTDSLDGPLELREVTGTAYVTESFLLFAAHAQAGDPSAPTKLTTRATVDLVKPATDTPDDNDLAPESPTINANPYQIEASAQGYDPTLRIEALVGVFSPTAAGALADLRERHHPAGRLSASVTLEGSTGATPETRVTLDQVERLEFDAWGGRVAANDLEGDIHLSFGDEPRVTIDASRADAFYDGEPIGELSVTGDIGLAAGGALGTPGSELVAVLEGLRFESAPARSVVRERVGGELGAFIEQSKPRGDARVTLRAEWVEPEGEAGPNADPASVSSPDLTDTTNPATPGVLRLLTDLEPRTLTLTRPAGDIRFDDLSGSVRVTPEGSGEIRNLAARLDDPAGGDGWRVLLDGRWTIGPGGSLSAPLLMSLEGQGLGDPVRAALPIAVEATLESLSAQIDGRLWVRDLELHASRTALGEPVAVRVDGEVSFEDGSVVTGVPITGVTGAIAFATDLSEAGRSFRLTGAFDGFEALNLSLTNGSIELVSGGAFVDTAPVADTPPAEPEASDRTVLVRGFSADLHGGRIAGSGVLTPVEGAPDPAPGEPPAPMNYELRFSGAGIRFDPMLADLKGETASAETSDNPAVVDGNFVLEGRVGDPETRLGRGEVQVGEGRLIDLPLIMPLIEVSNLQVPTGQRLGLARSEFYLAGNRVTFDELSVFSDSVELFGYGTMELPSLALDLRFHSRAVRRLPLLSQIVESLRDELITTTVAGTLNQPDIKLEQLRGTRQVLGALFGQRQSDAERRLDEIERRAREGRARARDLRERGRGLSGDASFAAEEADG